MYVAMYMRAYVSFVLIYVHSCYVRTYVKYSDLTSKEFSMVHISETSGCISCLWYI